MIAGQRVGGPAGRTRTGHPRARRWATSSARRPSRRRFGEWPSSCPASRSWSRSTASPPPTTRSGSSSSPRAWLPCTPSSPTASRSSGYIHWSAFDNFEWASGYAMQFGLIAVDRTTQERTVKPSARFLGEVARANTSCGLAESDRPSGSRTPPAAREPQIAQDRRCCAGPGDPSRQRPLAPTARTCQLECHR